MVLKKSNLLSKKGSAASVLLAIPILIFSLGAITLLSVSPERFNSHLLYFIFGITFFLVFSYFDFSILKYFWIYIYFIGLGFLALTIIFGEIRYGAARWLSIGSFGFQTAEFAKIALILSLSAYVKNVDYNLNKPIELLKIIGLALPYIVLVYIQPDLGTSLVLFAILFGILFYAGLDKIYMIVSVLLAAIFSTPLWHLLKDYQKERILVFINPKLDVLGAGYNVIQSLIAVGSGGLLGKGFGRGTQATLSFLPAYWTDFIFASFAEEWGFIGVLTLLFFFIALLFVLLYVAANSQSKFGSLICIGTFSMLLSQFVINVGMNLGLMPVTGVTLPLMSYGGSSIVTTMTLLGITANIWQRE